LCSPLQGYVEYGGSDDKQAKPGGLYEPALVARILYQMEPEKGGLPK